MGDLYEYDDELEYDEADEWEFENEFEAALDDAEYGHETDDEMELAVELLEITDDEELDQFLGDLIKSVTRKAGRFVRSKAGRALGGLLKKAVKKALPGVGSAIGGYFGGAKGAQIGKRFASSAGQIFGLELEGMSPEDQEFEAARRIIRLATSASGQLTRQPQTKIPDQAARAALLAAAKRHAPGLLGTSTQGHVCKCCGGSRSGRWIRRGRNIFVIDSRG